MMRIVWMQYPRVCNRKAQATMPFDPAMSDAIETAMARVPEWPGLANVRCEPIEGGLTNRSYCIITRKERFVLRLNAPNSEAMALDRNHECEVLSAAETAGIGPDVVRCLPDQGLLVTRWIEGRRWSLTDIGKSQNIARLAARLRDIHALPATGKPFDPVASMQTYARIIQVAGISLPPQAHSLRERVESLGPDNIRATHLCHNDIVHTNIIDGGRLRVVDWEYAAMGDPMFDLATVTRYHRFSRAQTDKLLTSYGGDVSRSQRARFEDMQMVFDALHLFWLLAQKATSQLSGEIDTRIKGLVGFLENPP